MYTQVHACAHKYTPVHACAHQVMHTCIHMCITWAPGIHVHTFGFHVHACTCRYENPEIALNCGMMLRECVRHEPLCKIVLYSEEFYNFFGFVEVSTFDIASDAFATFKVR